mgnify:CR=1 FL=1
MNSASAETAVRNRAQRAAEKLQDAWITVIEWGTSPAFYAQLGAILIAILGAWLLAAVLRAKVPFWRREPGPGRFRQFMQFDADSVGASGPAADAEMCMMMADTMEALGIKRGDYVVRVNNRKVLDGFPG